MFAETVYDGISNWIDFYHKFKSSNSTKPITLSEFYKKYQIPVHRYDHQCVTLSMEIIHRFCLAHPILNDKMYLVSCKEDVDSIESYIFDFNRPGVNHSTQTLNIEHVLAAMRIQVAGREGVMLFDNGYHVPHVITVMKDGKCPHTGPFDLFGENYNYEFTLNDEFIEWTAIEGAKTTKNLIYIKSSYRTAVDVSIRQNLVHDFQLIVARDGTGDTYAAIHLHVTEDGEDSKFTFFYNLHGEHRFKVQFSLFKDEVNLFKNNLSFKFL